MSPRRSRGHRKRGTTGLAGATAGRSQQPRRPAASRAPGPRRRRRRARGRARARSEAGSRRSSRLPWRRASRPGSLRRDPRPRIGQSTPVAAGVRGEAGDAEQEADHEIRPGSSPDVQADAAHERRHPERAEDDADRPAEDADREPGGRCGPESQPAAAAGPNRAEDEVDPAPEEHGGDRRVEESLGELVGKQRAGDRADDRRRRHPGDDPPVDATLAQVSGGSGGRGRGGDRDVRSRGGERASRSQHDQRQPQRPEHESQHRAHVSGDERPDEG